MQQRENVERVSIEAERLLAIEARLGVLEDRAEIAQLIASYGPSVDSGSAEQTASLWAESGSYTYSTMGDSPEQLASETLSGRREFIEMVNGPGHQGIIANGSSHFIGVPHIQLDGDRATAVTYSLLIMRSATSGHNHIARMGANSWQLVRSAEGWRVANRTQSLLDGRAESRALLGLAAGKPSI